MPKITNKPPDIPYAYYSTHSFVCQYFLWKIANNISSLPRVENYLTSFNNYPLYLADCGET